MKKRKFSPYFPAADLDRVRIIECDPLPISGLPFRNLAHYLALDLSDVSLVSAITFDHIIASRRPLVPTLLFHELVHAVQYRLLGVTAFARLYTRGLLFTGSYEGIPLERCAIELEYRSRPSAHPLASNRRLRHGLRAVSCEAAVNLNEALLIGEAVPKPLGFIASRQNGVWACGATGAAPSYSGR